MAEKEITDSKISIKQVLSIGGVLVGLFTTYYAGQISTEKRFNAIESRMNTHEEVDKIKQKDLDDMKKKIDIMYDVVIKLK